MEFRGVYRWTTNLNNPLLSPTIYSSVLLDHSARLERDALNGLNVVSIQSCWRLLGITSVAMGEGVDSLRRITMQVINPDGWYQSHQCPNRVKHRSSKTRGCHPLGILP